MDKWRSPLRYPGGKFKLTPFLQQILKNNPKIDNYVEPFAGGGGIAINLLLNNIVDKIVLNDFDIAIFCFWKAITGSTSDFIKLFDEIPVNIEEWKKQKIVFNELQCKKSSELTSDEIVKLGFATFFLNRTNFSGILRGATPIGGLGQKGKWKIDCEFNKSRLRPLIESIGDYSDRITVSDLDMTKNLTDNDYDPKQTIMFIDPPYVTQGKRLYLPIKDMKDHKKIAKQVRKLKCNWILTYDSVNEIEDFYNFTDNRYIYTLQYKIKAHKKATEFLAISSDLNCDFNDTINIVKKI